MAGTRGVIGDLFDAPIRGEIRVRRESLVVFDSLGVISEILEQDDRLHEGRVRELAEGGRLERLPKKVVLLPGLIDLHNHAPQWPQMGKALDVPLEVWLNQYTFPLESRYSDVGFAASVYRSLVSAMLANGTTTAVYFGTVHLSATKTLVDLCLAAGQRAVVGKVAMDDPSGCPDYYRDASAASAIADTAEFIQYVNSHPDNAASLVLPAATPRFIPSCSDDVLGGLGDLVAETGCLVQTHCSESDWAHEYGMERYGRSDTKTYDEFGLLQRGTILAHANFIDHADMDLIAQAGASVAHCPLSNVFFANAVFPTRHTLSRNVHVGLGTDVSGGPSPSVFNAAANAVAVSRVREDGVDPEVGSPNRGVAESRITFAEAFWMATTGGGLALDLPIGLLEPGYRFDAIAVDTAAAESDLIVWADLDAPIDIVQKIINNAGRHEIARVWVDGKKVKGAE